VIDGIFIFVLPSQQYEPV